MAFSWLRFRWDLSALKKESSAPIAPFNIRHALQGEEATVFSVISSAYSMDASWGNTSKQFSVSLQDKINAIFEEETPPCLVFLHGSRIIGASVLNPISLAENHLLTGPCIAYEYRSRGLGTMLLLASLQTLRDESGLQTAYGLARSRTTISRFIYPKFGGVSEPYDLAGQLELLPGA